MLQPNASMWLATIALLPIGFFLIYKALHDSQLFNKEFYYRFFRKLRKKKAAAKNLTSYQRAGSRDLGRRPDDQERSAG